MKNNYTYTLLILAILFSANTVFSQTNNADLTQIETENKELSVSFPTGFAYFFDKEGLTFSKFPKTLENTQLKNFRSVTAYSDGVSMWLESYDTENGEDDFPYFLNFFSFIDGKASDFKIGEYKMRQYITEKDHYLAEYFIYSKSKIYYIGVAAQEKSNPRIVSFLTTVKFNGKNLFSAVGAEPQNFSSIKILEQIEPTPFEIIYPDKKKKDSEKTVDTDSEITDQTLSAIDKSADNKKPLRILVKYRPQFTRKARLKKLNGAVSIKATFGGNGQITKVEVLKDLGEGLTERAILAARRIRFLPLEKNGQTAATVKTVDFSFTIY